MISDLQTLEKLEIKKNSNSRDWKKKLSIELKVGEANGYNYLNFKEYMIDSSKPKVY